MRYLSRKVVLVVAIIAVVVMPVASQAPAQKPSFEVASVKPNKSGQSTPTQPSQITFLPGGRFTATNVTLVDVIVRVYPTRRIQMQGGPNWIDSDRFDIIAKADDAQSGIAKPDDAQADEPARGVLFTPPRMAQMVQALLEDRFQFRFHVEKKEMQVYALTLGKEPPKLQESKDGEVTGVVRGERGQLIFQKTPIVGLVNTISNIMRTPVVDGTGIRGLYDFTIDVLQFLTPSATNGTPRADSYDIANATVAAVQEQLGFKLEKRKQLLDIIVIDHAERPSEN